MPWASVLTFTLPALFGRNRTTPIPTTGLPVFSSTIKPVTVGGMMLLIGGMYLMGR